MPRLGCTQLRLLFRNLLLLPVRLPLRLPLPFSLRPLLLLLLPCGFSPALAAGPDDPLMLVIVCREREASYSWYSL